MTSSPDPDERRKGGDSSDERRKGDTRAFIYTGKMAWWPAKGYPFRWKPKHGDPECIGEEVSQAIWRYPRTVAYIAIVVTISLIVQVFDISLSWSP
jgi:hypothetical protein